MPAIQPSVRPVARVKTVLRCRTLRSSSSRRSATSRLFASMREPARSAAISCTEENGSGESPIALSGSATRRDQQDVLSATGPVAGRVAGGDQDVLLDSPERRHQLTGAVEGDQA